MSVYLSASSIRDFIKCPQMVLYRITKPFPIIMSKEMIVGNIMHTVLEKEWKDRDRALNLLKELAKEKNLPKSVVGNMEFQLDLFFFNFKNLLTDEDAIEYNFKVPMFEDVYLVGKMDRISKGRVFDWKTGNVSKHTEKDVQCMIYNYAYEKLFNKKPSEINLVSLSEGTLYPYMENSLNVEELFSNIIPRMIKTIRNSSYERLGIFNYSCFRCQFKQGCLKEVENVVDSPKSFI
jgi:PD-(D/E)XK nuclease superfamily